MQDAYRDVGGTIPGMESVDSSLDAYMDVGGTIPGMESVESSLERRPRKRLEHVFEQRSGKRPEHVFEQFPSAGFVVDSQGMAHISTILTSVPLRDARSEVNCPSLPLSFILVPGQEPPVNKENETV